MTQGLIEVLQAQKRRGLLGPGPVEEHIAHSRRLASVVEVPPARAVDLGSGAGVPGLVLAVGCWPDADLLLLDASQRRCTHLELAVGTLGLTTRVSVRWGRAEDVGRDPTVRAGHDVVVARSFGPPAVVAECGAPLLGVGGCLVVSDPPDGPGNRWDDEGLARLGLDREASKQVDGSWFTRLRQAKVCSPEFPRRSGVPARKPLF